MANRIQGCAGIFKAAEYTFPLGVKTPGTETIVIDTDDFSFNETNELDTFKTHGTCADQTEATTSGYEITVSGIYSTDDAGQVQLKNGGTIDWVFYMDATQTTGTDPSWGGEAKIGSIERSAPADGKVTFSLTATGNGPAIFTGTW